MEFQSVKLDYAATKSFAAFVDRYQKHDAAIAPYITAFASISTLKEQARKKSFSAENRKSLAATWRKQYEGIEGCEQQLAAIAMLEQENCFTLTTGHQCGLFAGPMYLIYKIISVINLAKEMNAADAEKRYLPVFWMATEDHDFAEINHINLLTKRITLNSEQEGNAVGRIPMTGVESCLQEIEELVQNFPYGKDAIEKLRKAYQSNHNISFATRTFIHELFKEDGLLILDADDASLKKNASSIFAKELESTENTELVERHTQHLIQAGILAKAQINARNTNLFLLESNKRKRIDRVDNGFAIKDMEEVKSLEEMLRIVNEESVTISPNVVLRPLYQESILPNICYIGGGAEVMYWLQIQPLFAKYQVPFPILMLRNSALILEKNPLDKFQSLGFELHDIFEKQAALQASYLAKHVETITLQAEIQQLESLFAELKKKVAELDKTLEASTESEASKNIASMRNLEQKIARAQKRKEETSLSQIEKFKSKYFPEEALQERFDNFLYFYSKYGNEFLNILKEQFHPLENKFDVLILD